MFANNSLLSTGSFVSLTLYLNLFIKSIFITLSNLTIITIATTGSSYFLH